MLYMYENHEMIDDFVLVWTNVKKEKKKKGLGTIAFFDLDLLER